MDLDLATRKVVAKAILDGDVGRALRLLVAVGVDIRDELRSPDARRKARQRSAGPPSGQRRDNVPDSVRTVGGTTAGHGAGQCPDEKGFPLSHSPLSQTSQPLDLLSSSLSSGASSPEQPSGLEGGAPVAVAPTAATFDAWGSVARIELRSGQAEGALSREAFAALVASASIHSARPLDAPDLWARFVDWTSSASPRTADLAATARTWLRNRIKFDRQDAERSRLASGKSVQPSHGQDWAGEAEARTEELLRAAVEP